jgi:hypothetical protein
MLQASHSSQRVLSSNVPFVAEIALIALAIDKVLTTQPTQQDAEMQIGIDPIFKDYSREKLLSSGKDSSTC